jgi:3-oxoadipate enol-lactonase
MAPVFQAAAVGAEPTGTGYVLGMDTTSHDLGAVRLHALEAGVGGAPLLLVHGFTGCKEDFAEEVDGLAELGYHVVAPDLRGHGESDQPDDEASYGLRSFADDLFALTERLGWASFDLLGHSMGGMIAQVMVLEQPDRVDRLVLMDTHHGVVGDLDLDLVAIGIELARTQGLEVIQQILQMSDVENPAYERACAARPGYREWSENKMLKCSAAMYAAMLHEMSTIDDRLDALGSVRVPTLVQVGELDAAFVGASERMAATIPGAQLVVHPDGAHCPQFESTESWRSSLHEFLGAASSRATAVA